MVMHIRYLLINLFLVTLVSARGGIGGRIAVFRPTSQTSTLTKLIKVEWDCDPFTNCNSKDFDCILEKCPYDKTIATDCPNKIVGQYSSMCLQIGVNDLKKKIFLGKSFSLVLESNVVAKCLKYDLFSHFVSECELFRVNYSDDSLRETVNTKKYQNHHVFYHGTTQNKLEIEIQQYTLMLKQIEFNKQTVELPVNDYRRIDFAISTPETLHKFKVSTSSGVSFTLPEGLTEKYALPIYAELNMGLKLANDDCYKVTEHETKVFIVKRLFCSILDFFSFEMDDY
jgi:hypothetical protein